MVSYWLDHSDINTTHIFMENDMEMKRKILAKADAPKIRKREPWQEPHILQWLIHLAKGHELCKVAY